MLKIMLSTVPILFGFLIYFLSVDAGSDESESLAILFSFSWIMLIAFWPNGDFRRGLKFVKWYDVVAALAAPIAIFFVVPGGVILVNGISYICFASFFFCGCVLTRRVID